MARPATHFSRVRRFRSMRDGSETTVTGTLCNRMSNAGEINCTDDAAQVTCKFCIRELASQVRRAA